MQYNPCSILQLLQRLRESPDESGRAAYRSHFLAPLAVLVLRDASLMLTPYCDLGDLVSCANYLNSAYQGRSHELIAVIIIKQVPHYDYVPPASVLVLSVPISSNTCSAHFVCTFTNQMLEAVRFLHSRHILHGDIKLNNWLIRAGTPRGAEPTMEINICLIDFGEWQFNLTCFYASKE
jgi:serine/threonine protein kinase